MKAQANKRRYKLELKLNIDAALGLQDYVNGDIDNPPYKYVQKAINRQVDAFWRDYRGLWLKGRRAKV